MKRFKIYYQLSPADKTFYPKQLEFDARDLESARKMGPKIVKDNTDPSEVKVIIDKIEAL